MSWPQWQNMTVPPSAVIPAAINPAPTVLTPGTQYTPEQWAQMQQQNWQQWAQWQQQYQQWQQQYGAQYQKSMNALNSTQPPLPVAMPNVSAPPPLPSEIKPPPPPNDPPTTRISQPPHYQAYPATTSVSNTFNTYPPNNQQAYQESYSDNINYGQPNRSEEQLNFKVNTSQPPPNMMVHTSAPPIQTNKRPIGPQAPLSDAKKNKPDPFLEKSSTEDAKRNAPPESAPVNPEELTEAEKKFDKQFADWESQFTKWKAQNVNHPDKTQYKEYEKKWENWRAHLLERREQMKRKRLGLTPTVATQGKDAPNVPNLDLKQNVKIPDDNPPQPVQAPGPKPLLEEPQIGFLQPTTTGGIPGLDLLNEKNKDASGEEENDPRKEKPKGPDLEALSRGINNILGDQKLLSMLNLVSQSPVAPTNPADEISTKSKNFNQSSRDYSNPEYEDYTNQEIDYYGKQDCGTDEVANFDDQTRSSFGGDFRHDKPGFQNNFQNPDTWRYENSNRGRGHNRRGGFNRPPNNYENDRFDENRDNFAPRNNQFNRGQNIEEGNFQRFDRMRNQDGGHFEQNNNFGRGRRGNFRGRFGNNYHGWQGPEDDFQENSDDFGGNFEEFGEQEADAEFEEPSGNFEEGSSHFESDQNNFERGPGNFDRDQGNFDRGQGNFDRGKGNFDRGPGNFNRGPSNFDRGQGNFDMGQGNFDKGQSSFDRGHGNFFDGGHANFEKPPPQFERPPPLFEKGAHVAEKGSDQFTRRSDNFEMDFERRPAQAGGFQHQESFGDKQFFEGNDGFENQDEWMDPDCSQENVPFETDDQYQDSQSSIPKENDSVHGSIHNQSSEIVEDESATFWKPEVVTDYDHKPLNKIDFDVAVEPLQTFDYRHKPLNRIPFSLRPQWLTNEVKFIAQFEPLIRQYEQPYRRYPSFEPQESRRIETHKKYDYSNRRSYEEEDRFIPSKSNDKKSRERDERKYYDDNKKNDRWIEEKRSPDRERRFFEGRSTFEEKRPFENKRSFEEKRPFEPRRSFEENRSFDERRSSENQNRSFDDRRSSENQSRSFDDRRSSENQSRSFDDRRSLENQSRSFDDRRALENRSSLEERRPFEEKRFPLKTPPDNISKQNADPKITLSKPNVTLIEDILSPPGRHNRAPRIVIILRGPPGSGKTFLAKLIKDREMENGGSAPRILSLDDYFMVEQEVEVEEEGRRIKTKQMVYEYEQCMEAAYRQSLMKAFKKTITDGFFPFIIVDNVNEKVKFFGEMWSFAKQNGFQVYICQLDLDAQTCTKRNIHNRTEAEIEKCVAAWETTPTHHPVLDATSLIQSGSISEVEMEEINSPPSEQDDEGPEGQMFASKWDKLDYTNDNLAKLDGTNKPLRTSRTMEDYLQLDDQWVQKACTKPGQKRVRWADLEERKQQEKMRAIGFVVGQTDWDRMMDPTMGESALTQTKYIERVRRY